MNEKRRKAAREHTDGRGARKKRRVLPWTAAAAAVLAAAIAGGVLLRPGGGPLVTSAYAIEQAVYPETAPYPDETEYINPLTGDFDDEGFSQVYDAWRESLLAQREAGQRLADDPGGLPAFLRAAIPQFLSGSPGENRACSPLNVYMALAMLAELTGGESRQQILDLLGAESGEALRAQANALWQAHYRSDGGTTSILASSLWLNQEISFLPETMETLANTYYASSYQGEMGSADFDRALQDWLNAQTGGLLEGQIQDITLDAETVLALATTLYFQAKWADEFSESRTSPQSFHTLTEDITCDFMHGSRVSTYYWGERFGAVGLPLENGGGTMWFLLPDEGYTPEDLLSDDQAMAFLLSDGEWENSKDLIINLSLPKFDITSKLDLGEGLKALGITDVFDPQVSDFTPTTRDLEGIFLSQARHGVRVAIDEEGVTAAAYTVMSMAGASAPPEDEMDFTLDRPFLFAVTSDAGLPLFVGSVYRPG